MSSSHQSQRDPYEVLGIDRNATPKEIRSAYKKLALKHHPDKVPLDKKEEATQRFAEISHAYETLTNPDATTTQQGQPQSSQYQQQGFSSGGGFGASPFGASSFGGGGANSIFDDFFGNSSRGGAFGPLGGGGLFFNPSFHFTDPFELFNQVFGNDELNGGNNHRSHHARSLDPMANMMRMSSMMGGMGGGMMGGGGSFQTSFSSGGFSGGGMNMMSTSSSSQSVYDPTTGGTKVIKTTTQTLNGKTTKRVETTLLYPDGRQETTVEQIGNGGSNRPKALPASPSEPPQQQSLPSSSQSQRHQKKLPLQSLPDHHRHRHEQKQRRHQEEDVTKQQKQQRQHHTHQNQQQPQEEAPVIDLTSPSISEHQEDEDGQEEENNTSEEEEQEEEQEETYNEKKRKRKRHNDNDNDEERTKNAESEQQQVHDDDDDGDKNDEDNHNNNGNVQHESKKQKVNDDDQKDNNDDSNHITRQYIQTREELEGLTMKQLRQICKFYHIAMVGNHFKKSQLVDRLSDLIKEHPEGIVLEVDTRPCTPPPKKEIPVPDIPVDITLEDLENNFTNDQLRVLCRHYGERQIGGKPVLAKRLYNFLQQSQGNVPSFLLDTTKGDENEEEVESKLGSSTTNSNKATPASQSQPSQAQKGGPTTNLSMNHHQNPYGIPIPPPPPIIPITGVLGPPSSMNSVAPPPHPMYGGVPIPPPPPYPAFVTAVPPPYPYPYYTVPPPPPPPPPTTTTAASASQHVTDGRVPSPPTPAATDDN